MGRHVGVSWEDRDDTVRTKCDHGLLMCWSGQRAANDRGLVQSTEQVVQRVARYPSSSTDQSRFSPPIRRNLYLFSTHLVPTPWPDRPELVHC